MRSSLKWVLIFTVLGFTLTLVDLSPSYADDHFKKYLSALNLIRFKSGVAAADFTLKNEIGEEVSLSDYEGKVVMLNFWATWCGPCRAEMPDMARLYDKYKELGFVILAVNQQENASRVIGFKRELELDFPTVLDPFGRTGLKYGVRSLPTTYIIDKEGRTLGGAIGVRNWNSRDAQKLIESLLESDDSG